MNCSVITPPALSKYVIKHTGEEGLILGPEAGLHIWEMSQ